MKVSTVNENSALRIRVIPDLALQHPSRRSLVAHAAFALNTLSEQYRRKNPKSRKTGHA